MPGEPADSDIQADRGDQPGADVTARLLLALTALYVQRSNHTAEEQQQYTELALRLIEKAAPAACAAAAARLRPHPDAPAAVIARLDARSPHDGAGGAPSHSPQGRHAESRRVQDSLVQDRFSAAGLRLENQPGQDLADREADRQESRPESGPTIPPVAAARPPAPLTPELAEAFFAAAPSERRRILSEIAATDAADPSGSGRRFHVRIDTAPWQGRTGAFARDFARLIDAPKNLSERILNDPSGEPLVVAARATGMPLAMLQRILLLACPATNHSVQRVYDLTELYHGLDGGTARALLAAWREAPATDDEAPAAPAPVTNLRARLGALNARIENQAIRDSVTRAVPPAPRGGGGSGRV